MKKILLASLIAFCCVGCPAQKDAADSEYVSIDMSPADSAVRFMCNDVVVAQIMPNDSLVVYDSLKTIKVLIELMLSQMELLNPLGDPSENPYHFLNDSTEMIAPYIKED